MDVERVFSEGKEIILVGTAHISESSILLVKEVIEKEKPDNVAVELDVERYAQLKSGRKWRERNIGEVIRNGQTYLFLLNLLLANMQKQIGKKIGIKPGQDMMEAIKAAEANEIPITLADRSVRVTLKRALDAMGLKEKIFLLYSILAVFFGLKKEEITKEKIEELKRKDVITKLMEELSRDLPGVKKVLVDERDLYIANRILSAQGNKVVAVVGAGHIDGIKKYLDRKRETSHLLFVPKKRNYLKYLWLLVPAIFAALVVYGFFVKGIETSLTILLYWFLINGLLSAAGVLLARGHPFSILAAFAAAPFTSLHPMLAAGWFAGLAEAKVKNPKVKDFENLPKIDSYRDLQNNQVTRILLVTAYANLGSTIGTFVAFPFIVSLLA